MKPGDKVRLNYPPEFVTLPDYTAHNGQIVEIVRELEDGSEYDNEGERMYLVRAADGWTGHVWETELQEI